MSYIYIHIYRVVAIRMENVVDKRGLGRIIEPDSFRNLQLRFIFGKQFIVFRTYGPRAFYNTNTGTHEAERDEYTVHAKCRWTGQVARNTLHGKTSYGRVTGYRVRV